MSRSVRLAFVCLACFLVLLPLSLKKPGLPMRLAGDEATYFSMAMSLAVDADLRCDRSDLERLFAEFPFAEERLELASNDAWSTAHFGRPVIYPLLAMPFVALFGANGPIALNAIFFLLAIAFGWFHLRRVSDDSVALLFCLGFFLFSTAFHYLFRMQPQVMVMAAVTIALSLGWRGTKGQKQPQARKHRSWLSGAALGIAVLQEPALVALAVPLLGGLPDRRWAPAAVRWLAGCGITMILGVLLSISLTGNAWPDHLKRTGTATTFTLKSPLETPWQSADSTETPASENEAPDVRRSVVDLLEDASFLLWGRRTGILPYFPLIVPILLLFGFTGVTRRSRTPMHQEWLLVVTLVTLGILQLVFEPVARALHSTQVGNLHMVGVYPAFLFLIPRLKRAMVIASFGFGALVLGALISTNLGVVVPGADIHAHTRNFPLRLLPFEYPTLGRASGFRHLELHNLAQNGPPDSLWAPSDLVEIHGDELWLLGGESVELWLESRNKLPSAVFHLRNLASNNRISMRIAGQESTRDFEEMAAGGLNFRLEFEPSAPDRIRRDSDGEIYTYRLKLKTRTGEKPTWRQGPATDDYLGVALSFLGTREFLARDLFRMEWLACGAPPRAVPAEEFLAVARLRNLSVHAWPHRGPARVRLSYRWLDANDQEVPHASLRTELPSTIETGQEFASWVNVDAPNSPGTYTLELEPLFENVAWFSSRDPAATCRTEIQIGE